MFYPVELQVGDFFISADPGTGVGSKGFLVLEISPGTVQYARGENRVGVRVTALRIADNQKMIWVWSKHKQYYFTLVKGNDKKEEWPFYQRPVT